MQLATFGGLVFALFNFATSSALPMRDPAPFRQFDKELDDSHGDISPDSFSRHLVSFPAWT